MPWLRGISRSIGVYAGLERPDMCGIAGMIWSDGGPVDEAGLHRAASSLSHRGPDGQGFYRAPGLGLAHTRLSIIDLETGAQPLHDEAEDLWLVANGEIYNYIELRQELEAAGSRFLTHSDCEVILHAYARYGLDFLDHIFGMFAFALYDRRQDRIILARDRLGIKPLFVLHTSKGHVFTSELKTLFGLAGYSPEISVQGLLQFLQSNFSSGRTTILKDVERVLPGEMLLIERGRLDRRKYWDINGVRAEKWSYPEAAERFDGLMDQVIREHMRSDVPFGIFLSGGIDSATILARLRRFADGPLSSYSVGFASGDVHNELEAAARVARLMGTRHHALELGMSELLNRVPQMLWAADELMGDYACLPVSILAEEAGKDLKVVFSGEGGDEVFAGYARYRLPRLKRWMKSIESPGCGGFRPGPIFKGPWRRRLFGTALNEAAAQWNAPFRDAWAGTRSGVPDLQRMQTVDIETWLPDDLLVKADRMLMAWGLEGRVPYLDHRVVEFGLSLPEGLKMKGRTGKYFLRRWAEKDLPEDHLRMPKSGFTVPLGDLLSPDILNRLADALPRHEGIRQWFSEEGVQALVSRQLRKGDVTQMVWRMFCFAVWHSMFMGGNGLSRPAPYSNPVEMLEG